MPIKTGALRPINLADSRTKSRARARAAVPSIEIRFIGAACSAIFCRLRERLRLPYGDKRFAPKEKFGDPYCRVRAISIRRFFRGRRASSSFFATRGTSGVTKRARARVRLVTDNAIRDPRYGRREAPSALFVIGGTDKGSAPRRRDSRARYGPHDAGSLITQHQPGFCRARRRCTRRCRVLSYRATTLRV